MVSGNCAYLIRKSVYFNVVKIIKTRILFNDTSDKRCSKAPFKFSRIYTKITRSALIRGKCDNRHKRVILLHLDETLPNVEKPARFNAAHFAARLAKRFAQNKASLCENGSRRRRLAGVEESWCDWGLCARDLLSLWPFAFGQSSMIWCSNLTQCLFLAMFQSNWLTMHLLQRVWPVFWTVKIFIQVWNGSFDGHFEGGAT